MKKNLYNLQLIKLRNNWFPRLRYSSIPIYQRHMQIQKSVLFPLPNWFLLTLIHVCVQGSMLDNRRVKMNIMIFIMMSGDDSQ